MAHKILRDENIFYLYRHTRLDTNQPFYIGIGIKRKKHSATIESEYERAYHKHGRNKFWLNVVNKTNYKIDILLDSTNKDFIISKELEFIKLYGRRNLNLGSLVNLTDGGDGFNRTFSKETRQKISEKNKNRINNKEIIENMATYTRKSISQYDLEGNFIQNFPSLIAASRETGIDSSQISQIHSKDFFTYSAGGFRWKLNSN